MLKFNKDTFYYYYSGTSYGKGNFFNLRKPRWVQPVDSNLNSLSF